MNKKIESNDMQQTDSAAPETNTPKSEERKMIPQQALKQARYHLGQCRRRCDADDLSAALVEVDTALGIIPDTEEGRELAYEARLARTNVLLRLKLDEVGRDDEKEWTEHELEEVLLECARAKALKPGDPAVDALEAQIRLPLDDGTTPESFFERLLAVFPDTPQFSPVRALFLPMMGRDVESYDGARKLVEAAPGDALPRRMLLLAAEARGKTEEATRAGQRYLELCGRVPELEEAYRAWDRADEGARPEHHPPAYLVLCEPSCSALAFPHTDEGLKCAELTAETMSNSPLLMSLLSGPDADYYVEVLSWQDHDFDLISAF